MNIQTIKNFVQYSEFLEDRIITDIRENPDGYDDYNIEYWYHQYEKCLDTCIAILLEYAIPYSFEGLNIAERLTEGIRLIKLGLL